MPKTKGWSWNIDGTSRKGWRPGAVRKSVAKIMKFFASQRRIDDKVEEDEESEQIESPTLQILKRNGEYCVVLSSTPNDANPIVFMLTKSDFNKRISRVKEILREKGLKVSCNCEKNFNDCECMSCDVKGKIQFELERLSKDDEVDVLTSEQILQLLKSTNDDDDEVDLTFTPPTCFAAAATKSQQVKPFSYAATQYDSKDVTKVTLPTPIKAAESPLKVEMVNAARSGTKLSHGDGISLKKGSKDEKKM